MDADEKETCWTLIRGAASGVVEDRAEFARRYLPAVKSYLDARWKGTPLKEETEDIAQEVFVDCFREGGALARVTQRVDVGFRAFLYGVTQKVALQTERTRARRVQRVRDGQTEIDFAVADERTMSRAFDRRYAIAVMERAREAMTRRAEEQGPDHERRVELLRLRFEDGLPIREIAKLWDIDAARLHREYQKANREFKAALAETVADSERCAPERLQTECDRLLDLLD